MAELTGKTISEFPSATTLADADLFPVSVSGASGKLSWGTLKTLIQSFIQTLKPHKEVDYVDDTSARSITIGSGNYYNLETSGQPAIPSLPSGAKIIAVSIVTWSSNSGAFSLIPYGDNGVYAIGASGTTISGLKCRFWYAL